jgi:glycosyltransferase involved in cell wall biosynthesis
VNSIASFERDRPVVCHVITTLEIGGAQMMLHKLLATAGSQRFTHTVISLGVEEPMAERIRSLGVPVECIGFRRSGLNALAGLWSLRSMLNRLRPAVVQTWMHHADLFGGMAARSAGIERVVWGIRHSDLDPAVTKRRTLIIAKLCAAVSKRIPTSILCCSEASRRSHRRIGYAEDRMVVIPNGYDLRLFTPRPEARAGVLSEFDLPEDAHLIGLFARFHGMKGHRTFLRAAGLLSRQVPNAYFLLCGEGVDHSNPQLAAWMEQDGITSRCRLLGRRDDIPRLTAALDIATSSSESGEGFSNTIGEAMASAVVCVVTDVGDSARIVGDTGKVVPPGRPDLTCEAWRNLLEACPSFREALGSAARRRIEQNFSVHQVTARYEDLYHRLLHDSRTELASYAN